MGAENFVEKLEW